MSMPYTPPPATVTYRVRINSGEWAEYATAVNSSKFVADNIFAGYSAEVEFKDAIDIKQVRDKFGLRIAGWLKQLGHTDGFWHEPTAVGADYRLIQ